MDELNGVFSDDVLFVIKNKLLSSAPGHDGLSYQVWKQCAESPVIFNFQTACFNRIFMTRIVPDSWREVDLAILFKGKGSLADPINYRGISLLSTLLKIFETLLQR